jgi:hypothetical protein
VHNLTVRYCIRRVGKRLFFDLGPLNEVRANVMAALDQDRTEAAL